MSSSTWLEAYLVNCATHFHILHPLGLRQPNFIQEPLRQLKFSSPFNPCYLSYLIHAFVSDGAPPNRTFYKMMVQRDEDMFYTVSPFNRSRRIYFVSDVPHLLKTTRNCFENSCCNNQTRNLHVSTERLLQF